MSKDIFFLGTLIVMGGPALSAQAVSFGVIGAVPFTDGARYNDTSRRYEVGPTIEVRLPAGFALEASALYRRIGTTSSFNFFDGPASTAFVNRQRGNAWEFPLLGKYYFRSRSSNWQPFVGTGYTVRSVWWHSEGSTTTTDSSGTRLANFKNDYNDIDIGASVAAGIRFKQDHFSFRPEIRYTRYGDSSSSQAPRNEAKFLLGITF